MTSVRRMAVLLLGVWVSWGVEAQPPMLWGDSLDDSVASPAPAPWPHGEGGATAQNKTTAPSDLRWAVLRCTYPGSPAQPLTSAQARRLFEKPDTGLFSFFERQSRGALHQEIAFIVDVTLPQTVGGYWSQATSVSAFLLASTADCLAGAAQSNSLDSVTAVAVFYNDVIDCCAYGGPLTLSLPGGATRRVPAVWLPPAAHTQPIVIAHEMMHGLNIGHSNNTDRDFDTTDNLWDLMSNIRLNRQVDPEIGPLPRGLHAFHRHTLGWLDAAAVTDIQVAEGPDHTVELVLGPDSLARLHFTPTTGLTVSFRGASHADEGERAEPAVFIDELDTVRVQPLWVVDEALPLPTVAGTSSSYFTSGESWAVEEATPGRAAMVEVVSVSASDAVVRVHLGPPPPPVQIWHNGFETTEVER